MKQKNLQIHKTKKDYKSQRKVEESRCQFRCLCQILKEFLPCKMTGLIGEVMASSELHFGCMKELRHTGKNN
jgi:hypothetical protein